MDKKTIVGLLREQDRKALAHLCAQADAVRQRFVGNAVQLRGLIEFSNYCSRSCLYCGLRPQNRLLKRYRMSPDEIFAAALRAKRLHIPTVVLQSGEDSSTDIASMGALVQRIKNLGLCVTLSLGELSHADYKLLRQAGADRYLLKFETSDKKLYGKLRPGCRLKDRLRCLDWIKELGFETGSGSMIGLPGQTLESIADDILLYKKLCLDMIGIGPFIAHPHTPLAKNPAVDLELVLKSIALTRILTRDTNMPATTAIGTADSSGRQKALQCGANVLMPNITPRKYRRYYEIYPDKLSLKDDTTESMRFIRTMVKGLGRTIAAGPGYRKAR
jgi:biotin synthase